MKDTSNVVEYKEQPIRPQDLYICWWGFEKLYMTPETVISRSWGSTRGSLNTAECGEQLYSEGIHDKTGLQDVVSN